MLRMIKHWLRKLKMTQRNGKIHHALGLEELISLKWPYYPKQSTDLMQEENGKPLQYSFLENSMDKGAWQATVHVVAKNQTELSTHTHTIKLPVTFSTELEQITIKFIWNHKKIQNCQSIPEKKEQSRRHNPPRHQTILQSHSNQSSMVTDIGVNGTE